MAEITVTIDIPDGVDPDWIIARAKELPNDALSLIGEARAQEQSKRLARAILEDDDRLYAWLTENQISPNVVARAKCYPHMMGYHLDGPRAHLFHSAGMGRDDRRPVYMLGSLGVISERIKSHHWVDDVARRYARMTKKTLLSWEEIYKFLVYVESRINAKFNRVGARISCPHIKFQMWSEGPRNCREFNIYKLVWVAGRQVSLPTGAIFYLLNLRALGEKAERLERYALKHAA